MSLIEILVKRGYKEYESYEERVRFFQKKFKGKIVCDCNEANYINVEIWKHVIMGNIPQVEIGLKAEKDKKWWGIKCYGLSEKEAIKNIAKIEKKIIRAFESIGGK